MNTDPAAKTCMRIKSPWTPLPMAGRRGNKKRLWVAKASLRMSRNEADAQVEQMDQAMKREIE
ncbi:hypothetical protein [Sulfobacillus harzensis]|uniref:Uncharacterized protein n=1 Tax=Sulfobacillus harzensis TaxID=2729629 RepID=A0A7Y0L6G5_9FIRM|nr:hypothetical protein [Sulfobacillus harzensis]NMP23325.1 hypothetical protein [Sulfobacillus harzensis]